MYTHVYKYTHIYTYVYKMCIHVYINHPYIRIYPTNPIIKNLASFKTPILFFVFYVY